MTERDREGEIEMLDDRLKTYQGLLQMKADQSTTWL